MLIRLAAENDAEEILEIYRPYVENTAISFETATPSKEEMEKRIRNVLTKNAWLVLEDGGRILGYAYASQHRERLAYRWAVDVSIYVRQGNHGQGIGKKLYSSLLTLVKWQGYYNAYAGICLPNAASVGIHEYFGFRQIAQYHEVGYKFDKWYDVGWWEKFLQEHHPQPQEPLALKDIDRKRVLEVLSALK